MKDLSPRDQKLVQKLAAGMKKQAAGIKAGFPPKSAHAAVSRKLRNVKIKSALEKALYKAGLTDRRLAKKHAELLDAQKTVSAVSGKDSGAGTVDFIDVPDHQVQVKALDLAYKLKGAYVEKVEVAHSGNITVEVIKF